MVSPHSGATSAIHRAALASSIALAGTLAPTEAQAFCCGAVLVCEGPTIGPGYIPSSYSYCADCTSGQSFLGLGGGCATGSCNVFRCNCDGHCRTGTPHCSTQPGASNVCVKGVAAATATSPSSVDAEEAPLAHFRRYDLDSDGAISIEEMLKTMGVHNETFPPDDPRHRAIQLLLGEFHALDENHNGKIDPPEFDRELK